MSDISGKQCPGSLEHSGMRKKKMSESWGWRTVGLEHSGGGKEGRDRDREGKKKTHGEFYCKIILH